MAERGCAESQPQPRSQFHVLDTAPERGCVADQPQRVCWHGNHGKSGVLWLVLRTQPRSICVVSGGSVKMHPFDPLSPFYLVHNIYFFIVKNRQRPSKIVKIN